MQLSVYSEYQRVVNRVREVVKNRKALEILTSVTLMNFFFRSSLMEANGRSVYITNAAALITAGSPLFNYVYNLIFLVSCCYFLFCASGSKLG